MAVIELVEALTVGQQAVGEAERARGTRFAAGRRCGRRRRRGHRRRAGRSTTTRDGQCDAADESAEAEEVVTDVFVPDGERQDDGDVDPGADRRARRRRRRPTTSRRTLADAAAAEVDAAEAGDAATAGRTLPAARPRPTPSERPLTHSEHAPGRARHPTPVAGSSVFVWSISYDGTGSAGWARQPGQRTVQGELEQALATVLRRAGRADRRRAAPTPACTPPARSRTATSRGRSGRSSATRLVRRLRGVLPPDIAVPRSRGAPATSTPASARSARHYVYRLTDAPVPARRRCAGPTPSRWPRTLDVDAMAAAPPACCSASTTSPPSAGAARARRRSARCWPCDVRPGRRRWSTVAASADAFCHSMVRSLVGALLGGRRGPAPAEWPAALLDAGPSGRARCRSRPPTA